MKIVVDRFEGDYVIIELESGKIVDIPKSVMPPNASEGDVIDLSIDKEATKKRRLEMKGKTQGIWD